MLFTQTFGLSVDQSQVDFVNIPLDTDIPLFIDPFALSLRNDVWSRDATDQIGEYFQNIVDAIRNSDLVQARRLLSALREPNETHLGLSMRRPRGSGLGPTTSENMLRALSSSRAVTTGFITSLEETELMVDGIGSDRISDLTTNIIRNKLIEYTGQQCALWGIPVRNVAAGAVFDRTAQAWMQEYAELPVFNGQRILLVPKFIARYDFSYDSNHYYQGFVLDYLQYELIQQGSPLGRTLKNGTRVVSKKVVAANYPKTKDYLYRFSSQHPEILDRYRTELRIEIERHDDPVISDRDVSEIATLLIEILQSIPAGRENATEFHSLMIGICEFVFYPALTRPVREAEIHEGRKRLDIVMDNSARRGFFFELPALGNIPGIRIAIELKNYSVDVGNPELDQLAGRFSRERGQIGISLSRHISDKPLVYQRCADTLSDGRGFIIPLDDQDIIEMLTNIGTGNRRRNDEKLRQIRNQILGFRR